MIVNSDTRSKNDELVKSQKIPLFVIPAKAGIQLYQMDTSFLDSGFRRSDECWDFLRKYQSYSYSNFSSALNRDYD
jgi:hypothetical protein